MPPFTRSTLHGMPQPNAPSRLSEGGFVPLGGFQPGTPELLAPPGSILSGQNVWIRNAVLEPRWKLSAQTFEHLSKATTNIVLAQGTFNRYGNTTNPASAGTRVLGAFVFEVPDFIDSTNQQQAAVMWISGNSNGIVFGSFCTLTSTISWMCSQLTYFSYGSTDVTKPSLLSTDDWRGVPAFDAALGTNVCIMSAGTRERLFIATGQFHDIGGGAQGIPVISYSRLSGGPRAGDIINFADRAVAWNCDGVTIRAQWHVEGSVTDWTGIGSGSQDLADMRGFGTRIFAEEDHMVLATNRELWQGRYVGLPYVFTFAPLHREIGIPYQRAAIQTPFGIFWLGEDFMLYRLDRQQVALFGASVQPFLRDVLQAPELAFFVYNSLLQQLRLFYTTSVTAYPTRALMYDFRTNTWATETYPHHFHYGMSSPMVEADAVTIATESNIRDGLRHNVGVYEALFTSAGTVGQLTASATSDFGVAVEEDAVFAPLQHATLDQRWFLDQARWDFAARSASSATVSWSTMLNATSAHNQRLSISASSNASQLITYPNVPGTSFTARVQSTNGGWQLRRVQTRSKTLGRHT